MKRVFRYTSQLLLGITVLSFSAWAQKSGDSTALYQSFVTSTKTLQTFPLYLDLHISTTSTFPTSPEDTATAAAEFFLTKGGSYVRYGELEQIINDSMALMVSSEAERMILYPDARPILAALKSSTGGGLQSNSLSHLMTAYTISQQREEGSKILMLTNRTLVPNTTFPKGSITLYTNAKTGEPQKVVTLRRVVVALSKEDFDLVKDGQPQDRLLVLEGERYFLIKDVVTTYEYKTIDRDPSLQVPVKIGDRIVRNEAGEFVPVKNFETYGITLN